MRNGILSVRRFRIWVVGGIKYGRLVYQRNLGSGLGRVENHWKFRSGKNFEERCHRHHLITIISRSSQYQSNYLHHYHSIINVIVIINVVAFVVEIINIVIVSIIYLLFFCWKITFCCCFNFAEYQNPSFNNSWYKFSEWGKTCESTKLPKPSLVSIKTGYEWIFMNKESRNRSL